MKKGLIQILTLMIITLSLSAQPTQYQWVRSAGGSFITGGASANNQLTGFLVDKKGNTYVSGNVVEGMTFGDSIISRPNGSFGSYDALICKYDKCGKLIWYNILGGKASDGITSGAILSSDEKYIFTQLDLRHFTNDSIIIHLQNKDTVVKTLFTPYVKISTETGKIVQYWTGLTYPTGATYYINDRTYMSPNRMLAVINMVGNYNGVTKTGYEDILAILDSNLNVIRGRQLDSNMFTYYYQDYGIVRPAMEVDKYGNIYSGVILQPSNPSNVLHLFDTAFTGFARGDGVLFQLDSNLNLKRFRKSNCLMAVSYSADDNMYMSGGLNNSFYYDTTYFTGSHTATAPFNPIYIKIDTALNLKGYSYPERTVYMQYASIIKATTNKVYVTDLSFSDVKWGQDSVIGIPNVAQIGIWEFPKDSIRPSKVHLTSTFGVGAVLPGVIGADEQGNVTVGGLYSASFDAGHDTIYAAGANNPNIFTLHWGLDCADSTDALIAPLEPAALVATATGPHAVQVTWQDASRYEHSFHIYRSPDGVNGWTRIDTVLANTTQYIDVNVQPQTAYWYRVAAWNNNGESSFTNIDSALTWRDVGIAETNATLPYVNAWPNPTTDKLNVEVYSIGAKDATIQLSDINGREMANIKWQLSDGLNNNQMQLSGLASGIYYLTIRAGENMITRKISKMN